MSNKFDLLIKIFKFDNNTLIRRDYLRYSIKYYFNNVQSKILILFGFVSTEFVSCSKILFCFMYGSNLKL